MAKRQTVYLTDRTESVLGPIGGMTTLSGRINRVADRYGEVIDRIRVADKFTEAEWMLMRDACNGTTFEPAANVRALSHGIGDAIDLDQLDDKWSADGPALLEKLRALTYTEEVAVVEAVERWWQERPGLPEPVADEAAV